MRRPFGAIGCFFSHSVGLHPRLLTPTPLRGVGTIVYGSDQYEATSNKKERQNGRSLMTSVTVPSHLTLCVAGVSAARSSSTVKWSFTDKDVRATVSRRTQFAHIFKW